jgi:hypothetical protein
VSVVTHAQFRAWVEEARALVAPEWEVKVIFTVAPDQDADANNASIGVYSDYLRADLYCNPPSLSRPEHEVKRTAYHEILHLTLNDLDDAGKMAGRQLGSQASQLHYEAHNKELERVIDRLASVLSS